MLQVQEISSAAKVPSAAAAALLLPDCGGGGDSGGGGLFRTRAKSGAHAHARFSGSLRSRETHAPPLQPLMQQLAKTDDD